MKFANKLVNVLTKSVEKNGSIPLTNKHLLNIVKICINEIDKKCYIEELNALAAEFDAEDYGDK